MARWLAGSHCQSSWIESFHFIKSECLESRPREREREREKELRFRIRVRVRVLREEEEEEDDADGGGGEIACVRCDE